MNRTFGFLWLLSLTLLTPALADRDVVALRQNNTASLRLRDQHRAMMVRDRDLVRSPAEIENLLLFCRQRGITRLFVSTEGLRGTTIFGDRDFDWRYLISRAHRQGIDVYAMLGNSAWVNDLGQALLAAQQIFEFGYRATPGERFDGILFDFPLLSSLQPPAPLEEGIAPPSEREYQDLARTNAPTGGAAPSRSEEEAMRTPAEQANDAPRLYPVRPQERDTLTATSAIEDTNLLRQHFDAIERIRRHLAYRYRDQRLRFGLTIPAWLQTPVGWNGQVKFASDHFVDLADFVVVHNLPGQTIDVGEAADEVLRYAGRTGKEVLFRIELGYPVRAVPELLTLARQDELFVETFLADLLADFGGASAFAGVALDDYQSYLWLPDRREVERYESSAVGGWLNGDSRLRDWPQR